MRSNLIPALMPYDPYKDWLLALDFANLVNSPNGKPTFKTPYGIYDKFSSIPGASFSAGEIIFYNPVTGLWNFRTANDDTPTQGVGLDIAEGTTNKCTNYNAAPTATTNMSKYGDAAATLTVVDDTAALRAAGFGALIDAGKMNGKVYKLDNSAGTASASAKDTGQTNNTNTHTASALLRGVGNYRLGVENNSALVALPAAYQFRAFTGTPSFTSARFYIEAQPGAVVYFILNQLEEKPYATNPVIVAGASASRGAATPVITGLASILTPPFTLVAVANLSEIDGVDRDLLGLSASGINADSVYLVRNLANTALFAMTTGGVVQTSTTYPNKSGPRLLKMAWRVRSTQALPAADGVLGVSAAVTPPPLAVMHLGSRLGASRFLKSPLLFAGIAPDLTDAQLQAITASNGALTDFL